MAYELSNRGIDLIIISSTKEKLEKVASKCKTNITIHVADLRNEKEVFKIYDKFKDENIDILINNAGFGLFGFFDKTDLDRELEMIDVNIKAYHILTKLFLQDFVKRDSGYILNVA